MNALPPIPPVFVDPEPGTPPPLGAFQRRPAQYINAGWFMLLGGKVYRVKDRKTSKTSPRITFVLYPFDGGRPETESFFPREWVQTIKAVQS